MTAACRSDWCLKSCKLENASKPPKTWLPLAAQLFPGNEDIVSGSTLLTANAANVVKGDIILFKDKSAGQVELFFASGSEIKYVFKKLALVENCDLHAMWRFNVPESLLHRDAEAIATALAFAKTEREVATLIPWL